jgi:hypothetical protein
VNEGRRSVRFLRPQMGTAFVMSPLLPGNGSRNGPAQSSADVTRIRLAGLSGMIGALIWIAGISLEYSHNLQPPGSGLLFDLNQLMFLVAEACYVAAILGLAATRAAGRGRFGRAAPAMFLVGQVTLLVALVLGLLTHSVVADVLLPIGGLGVLFGSLSTGIAVMRTRRWRGWRRFAPIAFALYYLVLLVSLAVLNREPTYFTELLWSVAWFFVGFAIYSEAREAGYHSITRPPAAAEQG